MLACSIGWLACLLAQFDQCSSMAGPSKSLSCASASATQSDRASHKQTMSCTALKTLVDEWVWALHRMVSGHSPKQTVKQQVETEFCETIGLQWTKRRDALPLIMNTCM